MKMSITVVVNNLEEFSMIAGTSKLLEFSVYDNSGLPLNISTCTVKWVLAPFGQPSSNVAQVDGTITGLNTFEIDIPNADTETLSGKYIHQPIIISFDNKETRLGQGIITIIPQIPITT